MFTFRRTVPRNLPVVPVRVFSVDREGLHAPNLSFPSFSQEQA